MTRWHCIAAFGGVGFARPVAVFAMALCAAAAAVVCASVGAAADDAGKRPNFVVFLSDDHGSLDSTPYGAADVRTPNMQRLAERGMTFTHAFVASPSCAPSRAAMLTGLMPARNGAEANHTQKRREIEALPDALRRLGYETAAFGKVTHGQTNPADYGFDHMTARRDAATIDAFLRMRDPGRPLCLFVGSGAPHVPWPDGDGYGPAAVRLPPTFVDTPETRDARASYYAAVTKADDELGRLMDLAANYFDPKNTLFIYTSDHGAQWPFGKWNLYDAGIRVPLLARWEGVIGPGSRTDAMVQSIDLLPTLIDAAGGTVPGGLDGQSFLGVLRGTKTAARERIFTTHSGDGAVNVYPIRSLRTRDWKYILNLRPEFAHTTHIDKALRPDGGRYWLSWHARAESGDPAARRIVGRYYRRPREELYDLQSDPFEERNLADDPAQAERLRGMRAELEAWMREQRDAETVFNPPRLLSDPASTRPGPRAGADP